ncbi:MAG: PASTA domain-containing protein [Bacteroidetes bacterium]|nr:MAG: PASTA domain-containing protein [Bacteroidota bacterium]
MSLKRDIVVRVSLVYIGMLLVGLLILGKAFHLQLFGKETWGVEENSSVRHKVIEPNRGNIYSTDGRLLAVSVPFYEIRMDFLSGSFTRETFDRHVDELCKALSGLFQDRHWTTYKREMVAARESGNRYFLVKRNVTYSQLQKVRQFPIYRLGPYKGGVIYVQQSRRIRPYGMLAARTVGYTMSEDLNSVVGVEGAYDRDLKGVEGYRLMRRIRGDIWMPINDANEIEPRDGVDVVTTIDVDLQDVAENALHTQLLRHEADHGTVVLMEVETGKVRAIANLARDENGNYRETYNFAIGESTEPGSTFKLASMIALLEDGYVSPEDSIDVGNGVTTYYGQRMEDSGDRGLGRITIRRAFEASSNVGISRVVYEHYRQKPEQYINRLYEMGLNRTLGIEIRGEGIPEIKYTDHPLWSGLSLPWMSIGYEVRMTPLQILSFYNAVANNGKMIKPVFVEELRSHGKTLKRFTTETLNNHICSRQTLGQVQSMLEGVVENGTARNLANTHYRIAGKTGTAQVAISKEGYTESLYQASFAGYFPADRPKYSCIVVVNAPSRSIYYGNLVAGPIFREITDRIYIRELDMQGTENRLASVENQVPYSKSGMINELESTFRYLGIPLQKPEKRTEWVTAVTTAKGVVALPRDVPRNLVPDVVDMGLKDAVYLMEIRGLKVRVDGRGTVRQQSLPPGRIIRRGEMVTLGMSIKS